MHSSLMRRRRLGLHRREPSVALSSITRAAQHPRIVRFLALVACLFVITGVGLEIRQLLAPPGSTAGLAIGPQPATATVLALQPMGINGQLLLRMSSGVPLRSLVSAPGSFVTRDGSPLPVRNIVPGDTLVAYPKNQTEDRSQVSSSLSGIVVSAPDPGDNTMLLRVDSTRTIVVVLNNGTRITNTTGTGPGSTVLMDSDQVHVQGVLDTARDEMTRTAAVMRVGP